MTARWLWVRLYSLPLDSPLAISVAGEGDDVDRAPDTPVLDERGRLPAPKALYDIPVAKSFAEVREMVAGKN